MNLLDAAITLTLVMYGVAMIMATIRLFRGPRAQDRVVALDFIFLVALLGMLVLAIRYQSSTYFEAALLMAMFGFVSTAALAKFLLRGEVIE
ncbi:MAG: potassium efflux system protein PhaF [Ramlibacter sp.]|jgi:multicomponent K+:H+ antiporter subunit F|nr:potassium efflux system protein PhaF [Ramlibacter sp.]MCE3269797.1 potassium efflux system protein PhaF [Ramlibacter sp.]